MTFDMIFSAASIVALIGWAGLALLPGRRIVADTITALAIPALLPSPIAG
jgi:hypothetical protein